MTHTQEQLAMILNRQRKRGVEDAQRRRDYGHSNEAASYPNAAWPDVSRKAVQDAYDDGWAQQRIKINKPDSVCTERFGKGVRHTTQ
jgi:hypothetical protein